MYSVLTIGFGSIYHVYLYQSAVASWPKHDFYDDHFTMVLLHSHSCARMILAQCFAQDAKGRLVELFKE